MNTPIFYELFHSHPLHALSARTLASVLALGLALAGVWALLLGWGIGLGIDNFAMYFGWTALLMAILLIALFLSATLLRMEVIWLAFLLTLPLLTGLTDCLALVGADPERPRFRPWSGAGCNNSPSRRVYPWVRGGRTITPGSFVVSLITAWLGLAGVTLWAFLRVPRRRTHLQRKARQAEDQHPARPPQPLP